MKTFAAMLETLIHTPSRNRKIDVLAYYFANTPDPDRGIALAAITRDLSLQTVKPALLKELAKRKVDPELFDLSYDYVGDLAETIALIWPDKREGELPKLSDLLKTLNETSKAQTPGLVENLLSLATANERWALIKLATGGLRIGVSARLAKTALASYSGKPLAEIEEIWHGLACPYQPLFAWLDGASEKPIIDHTKIFHPLMLSHPIDVDRGFENLEPKDFQAEWKWDGIRVELVFNESSAKLFSRTGDDISNAFPDILENLTGAAVLDGELLVGHGFDPLDFNCLQQRLNRKTASKKHLQDFPAFIKAYDILFAGDEDVRHLPLVDRRKKLEDWIAAFPQGRIDLSVALSFSDWRALGNIRAQGAEDHGHEGVMIKRKDSLYIAGRPKGAWFKWKRDAKLVDAVLMYAQRGHGKRSSFYSDFTFGVWDGNDLVPIGKAYSGFTDEELKRLDKFVRDNTMKRFGPVRELKKQLVVEVAFDSAHESQRHKSGIALRFPRINRIRWDKPAKEVEGLSEVKAALLGKLD